MIKEWFDAFRKESALPRVRAGYPASSSATPRTGDAAVTQGHASATACEVTAGTVTGYRVWRLSPRTPQEPRFLEALVMDTRWRPRYAMTSMRGRARLSISAIIHVIFGLSMLAELIVLSLMEGEPEVFTQPSVLALVGFLIAALPAMERMGRTSEKHAGVYAWNSPTKATGRAWLGADCVLGTVRLWGHVDEHTDGYRAQFGYPASVTHAVCWRCGRFVVLTECQEEDTPRHMECKIGPLAYLRLLSAARTSEIRSLGICYGIKVGTE